MRAGGGPVAGVVVAESGPGTVELRAGQLAAARAGRYGARSLGRLPPELVSRYFAPEAAAGGRAWRILPDLRASVRFGYRLRGEDGAELCVGTTEHCTTTREGRPCRPPADLAALLGRAPRVDDALRARLA